MTWALVSTALLAAFGLAMVGCPLWLWTLFAAGLLVLSHALLGPSIGFWALAASWGIMALLTVPWVRRPLVTARARRFCRALLPRVSATEQEALEAGDVWWDAELFSGRPRWGKLLANAPGALSPEEDAFLAGPCEELCRRLDDWQITKNRDLSPEVWDFIKTRGFLGMIIPKEYGGLGFSAQAHSAVVMKLAARSCTAAITVMVPNSLGPAELLLHFGTQEQRDRHLPRLARGEDIPSFALTSPDAGSDAAAMPDRGVVTRGRHDGAEVLGIRLSWKKRYITLAPVTTLLGVAFKLSDPERLLGGEQELGITLALIPASHQGVTVGRRHDAAKQAMLNGPTEGRDVFIPVDWIIGGAARAGHGWRMLMSCLAAGRAISLPATSTAAVKFSVRVTGAYARIRHQFKVPLGRFEGVEEVLARMAGEAYVLEAARRVTAAAVDAGKKPSVVSALLKYQATERMRRVVNDAMDIHGGRAICEGPSNYLSNAYQYIPISITVEGANILTRTLIVFGQGAIRCHPWLLEEMEAATDSDARRGVRRFDRALMGHIRHVLSNLTRAFFHNLTGGRFCRAGVSSPMSPWYRQLTRASASFAIVSDAVLLSLGGALKRKEKLSGRLADALGELYLASCVLKRFEDDARPAEDRSIVDWALTRSLHTIQESLSGVLENLPSRPLAWLLGRIVFPWGRTRRPPSDRLGSHLARIVMEPSKARDRLTSGLFVTGDATDVTGRLEVALDLVHRAAGPEGLLKEATKSGQVARASRQAMILDAKSKGILSEDQVELLHAADRATQDVIRVDDFGSDEMPSLTLERSAKPRPARVTSPGC